MVRVPIGIQLVSPRQNAFVHVYVDPGARNAASMRRRNTPHACMYVCRHRHSGAPARLNDGGGGGRYASRRGATRRARNPTVPLYEHRPQNLL